MAGPVPLKKLEFLRNNRNKGSIISSMLSLAYAASGFKDINSVYNAFIKDNNGDIDSSWLTLAVSSSDNPQQTINTILNKYNNEFRWHGTTTGAILALAYGMSGFEDVMPTFKRYYSYTNGDINGSLLTLAYAQALNPNNKLFPKR